MKVIHINQSDAKGGAAIAAYRVHRSVLDQGICSEMWVDRKYSDDATVKEKLNLFERVARKLFSRLSKVLIRSAGIKQIGYCNLGIFGSPWIKYLNASDADVVHLHWLGNEIISIKQLRKIEKPCVVTLHDEWLLGNGFHIPQIPNSMKIDSRVSNFLFGYTRKARIRNHNKNLGLVAPSRFMGKIVRAHPLFKDNRMKVIGHPIALPEWKPKPKSEAKNDLGIPSEKFVILYSCFGGVEDANKGFDDFCAAVRLFSESNSELALQVMLMGHFKESDVKEIRPPTMLVGAPEGKAELIDIYSASDVVLIPSKYESFGLVAQEVCALGIPLVAYEGTGLSDFVHHKINGYLAHRGRIDELVAGLEFWNRTKGSLSGMSSVRDLMEDYSPSSVSNLYVDFYKELISETIN